MVVVGVVVVVVVVVRVESCSRWLLLVLLL